MRMTAGRSGMALPLGLMDVEVRALDEHRSGLHLAWRRERRQRL